VPCTLSDTVEPLSTDAEYCLSFNPGEQHTVIIGKSVQIYHFMQIIAEGINVSSKLNCLLG